MNEGIADEGFKTDLENCKRLQKKFYIRKCEKEEANRVKLLEPRFCTERETVKKVILNTANALNSRSAEMLDSNDRWLNQKRKYSNCEVSSSSVSKSDKSSSKLMQDFNTGRWTDLEHKKFLEAILKYGNEWKKVQTYIATRSSTQARSHAQKFFLRLKKNFKFPEEVNDSGISPVIFEGGDKRKKVSENHKYDSILKFLTDYSKNMESNEEYFSITESNSMSKDQRKKLISIVLNFTRNTSDCSSGRINKIRRRREEDEMEESRSSENSNFLSNCKPEKSFASKIFNVKKVKRERKEVVMQSAQNGIATYSVHNNFHKNYQNSILNNFQNCLHNNFQNVLQNNLFEVPNVQIEEATYDHFSPLIKSNPLNNVNVLVSVTGSTNATLSSISANHLKQDLFQPESFLYNNNSDLHLSYDNKYLAVKENVDLKLKSTECKNELITCIKTSEISTNSSLNNSSCSCNCSPQNAFSNNKYSPPAADVEKENFCSKIVPIVPIFSSVPIGPIIPTVILKNACYIYPTNIASNIGLNVSPINPINNINNMNAINAINQLTLNNTNNYYNNGYANLLPNKNNVYEEIKTFFNNNRKNSERRLSMNSRKSSMRESDMRTIFNENEKIFSDKNFVEKQEHHEEIVKNPFELKFDIEMEDFPSDNEKKEENSILSYRESVKVEYEDINNAIY